MTDLAQLELDLINAIGGAATVAAIQSEFRERRGADFVYDPLLGDRDPPLDYRASVAR